MNTLNKQLHIVHIIPTLGRGGAERLIVDQVRLYDAYNMRASVVCYKNPGTYAKEVIDAGAYVDHIGNKTQVRIKSFIRLVKTLRNLKPDVVHTHLFGADFFGVLAARVAGVQTIISTAHNVVESESYAKQKALHWSMKHVSHVIAVSNSVKISVCKKLDVPLRKITVVENGIDLSRFVGEYKKLNTDSPNLLSIGRLTVQKGHTYAIEAMPRILMQYPKACLQIAGSGELQATLHKQAHALCVEKSVIFLGDRNDIPELLSQADILITPSLWEGLGIVLLEAQASKTPVIASQVTGIVDVVKDKETGVLVEPANPAQLAETVCDVLKNNSNAEIMVNKAYTEVSEKYSIASMTNSYRHVYDLCV